MFAPAGLFHVPLAVKVWDDGAGGAAILTISLPLGLVIDLLKPPDTVILESRYPKVVSLTRAKT